MRVFQGRWYRKWCALLGLVLAALLLVGPSVLCKTSPLNCGRFDLKENVVRFSMDSTKPTNSSHLAVQSALSPSNDSQQLSNTNKKLPHHQSHLKKVNCKKPHCKEFLSRMDKFRFSSCFQEVLKHLRGASPKEIESKIAENDCHFQNVRGRKPVALASAEGSGNTWVRGLLEKASGVCTGFNFCDYIMRMKGFIGDNINSAAVLVVKTHTDHPQWVGSEAPHNKLEAQYGSGIFLLRNPYDSLVAEWNRRLTNQVMIKQKLPHDESHVNVAPKEIWCECSWGERDGAKLNQCTDLLSYHAMP